MAEIIYDKEITDVLPQRFLEYSIDVLKNRAIPNGYDGLKPIHRKVLMAMKDLGLYSKSPYRKCAKTIGEVLGKYHPHGDQSAYEALVGLAQDFNMRYPLVDGSGNFGSVNGDPAAAMRYTEARLSVYGELMLEGVDKLSDKQPNFDNSAEEPITLSSYFPNLLLNAQRGIAVGLATRFAPHYARDVYTALIKCIELEIKGKDFSIEDIVSIIKAPDFPTGAEIINGNEMLDIYKTGHGTVMLRSKYRIEKDLIVFYEIPYKVTPKSILEDIVKLNLEDVKDVRDESSLQNGLRIVVELKKSSEAEFVVRKLFKDTKLQCGYSVNMTAIMNDRPVADVNIKDLYDYYLGNLKKTHYKSKEIAKKEFTDKLFVVETMLKAIGCIEDIIRIVRYSDEPLEDMQLKLGFTQSEAEYIYNIRISSISKANRLDLEKKQSDYKNEIVELDNLLANYSVFLKDLSSKLKEIRDSKLFKNDCRRTEISVVEGYNEFSVKDVVKKEQIILTYSNFGFVRISKADEYKVIGRYCVGSRTKLREDEHIVESIALTTHDDLFMISNFGRSFKMPVYKIPVGNKNSLGKSINSFLNLEEGEEIVFFKSLNNIDADLSVVFVTSKGYIKRIRFDEAVSSKHSLRGINVLPLLEGDKVVSVQLAGADMGLAVFTDKGRGIVFNLDDGKDSVRFSGRQAKGLKCIRLLEDETVISGSLLDSKGILLVSSKGYSKYVLKCNFKIKKRNQVPVRFMPEDAGRIASAISYDGKSNIYIITVKGQNILLDSEDFVGLSRIARGVKMIKLKDPDDEVVRIHTVLPEDIEQERIDF